MKDDDLSRRELLRLGGAAGIAAAATTTLRPGIAEAGEGTPLPQVPRRVLGKTGEQIPILLMGAAMKLDPRFDPKLAEGLRFGVNYIDAADCYGGGTCEPAVGAFHTRASLRKKLWITSKSDAHDPDGFEGTVRASLEKLKTDYIDMYYLHALQDEKYLSKELLAVVEKLKKSGKIKFFGFSCHNDNVAELLQLSAKLPWVDSVMFRYNFRQYGDKKLNDAIDAAHKAKVGLIAMKTQGSEASFQAAWQKFEKTGKWNKHQAVLKAVWEDERITAAVSHMDTFEKLKQNIAAALDKSKLTALEHESIHKYADATRKLACDGCDHLCGAAVQAPVQIGATMRYLMYHDVYGDADEARRRFTALPAEARGLSGIDFSAANAACPHGVDVAAHMRRASELFEA
jgi:predicted aldo/keto reductase-like oxidoreductase